MENDGADIIQKAMDALRAVETKINDAQMELALNESMFEMAREEESDMSMEYRCWLFGP